MEDDIGEWQAGQMKNFLTCLLFVDIALTSVGRDDMNHLIFSTRAQVTPIFV